VTTIQTGKRDKTDVADWNLSVQRVTDDDCIVGYTDCSSAHQTCLHNHRHRRRNNLLEYSFRRCTETGRHGMLHSHIENTRATITLLSFAAVLLRVEGSWDSSLEMQEMGIRF